MITIVFTTDTSERTTAMYMERASKSYPKDTLELATSVNKAEILLDKHGKDVRGMDCGGQLVERDEIRRFLEHIRKEDKDDVEDAA